MSAIWWILPLYIAAESMVVLIINIPSVDGEPAYNSGSVVLVQEVLKLAISLYGLSSVPGGFNQLVQMPPKEWLKFGIPGLLYCVNNNLFIMVVAGNMPAAFQMLLNVRVLWTGVMFYFLMGRMLTKKQWLALFVLCIGAVLTQLDLLLGDVEMEGESGSASGQGAEKPVFTIRALATTLLYTWISVGAGVYNETLLKSENVSRSIHLANVPLYMWGILFNAATVVASMQTVDDDGADAGAAMEDAGFWRGWDLPTTWLLTAIQAGVGLGISVLMRRYDNVVKILGVSMSNIIVYIVGIVHSGYPLDATFVLGGSLILASAYIYSTSGVKAVTHKSKLAAAVPPTDDDDTIIPAKSPSSSRLHLRPRSPKAEHR